MSSLGSPNPFFIAGKKAYEIERSLRFNPTDNANLTRTSSSASTTFTYSVWIKRCTFTGYQYIFSMGNRGFAFHTSNNTFYLYDTSALNESTAVFRDPSAWYHIVVQINSGVATSYVNNVLVHNGINGGFTLTTGTNETRIGVYNSNDYDFSGYMAEINLVDGSVVAPSSFAETDPLTGQWNPKKYTGSYGTNGFYLNFSDNSGTTATTLGKDYSGNGNNFTPNNFSVSAGEGNDSLEDTPTNNFPTINPLDGGTNALLTNGNLTFKPNSSNSGNFNVFYSTFSMRSGKWYFEVLIVNENSGTNSIQFGIGSYKYKRDSTNQNGYPGTSGLTFLNVNNSNSTYRIGVVDGSSVGSSISTASTNDVYGIAFDADNKKVYFYKNGSAEGESSGYNVTDVGTGDFFFFSTLRYSTGGSYQSGEPTLAVNFGQRAFSYTAPTGYKKLNSTNLPDPTIKLPDKHFDTLLYTGNDGTQNITGLNFNPDWVWAKNRQDAGYHHDLYDTVRGDNLRIFSSQNSAEATGYLQFGITGGFSLTSGGGINNNGSNHVAWNWNAGDTDGKTYTVKVVSDSGNKYRFDDFGTSAVTLDLAEGGTYIFDQSDSSNAGHPLRFSTTSNGTHGGGSEYTTGVTTAGTPGQSGAYTQIVVAASAPTLYYYCSVHSGMGGQANTNSTLGSSNFDGTIQTTVKVNATAGFSIVTYTGNGNTSATIGHGLGVAPNVIILKNRSSATDWVVMHSSSPFYDGGNYKHQPIKLSSTDGFVNILGLWATPNSSTQSISDGQTSSSNRPLSNASGDNYVAYCFSEVAGYSKFGKYTGNGNADGTFVFTGFRPAWVLIRNTVNGHNWHIYDSTRSTSNPALVTIYANRDLAEESNTSVTPFDILSNGFKIRSTWNDTNQNGSSIIYLAFAEAPFKNARAR